LKKSIVWTFPAIAVAALIAAYLPARLRGQDAPVQPPPPAPPESTVLIPSVPDVGDLDIQVGQLGASSGWLGVSVDEVSADKAKELKLPAVRGVLLTEVEDGSPAAKAGLKPGDVITDYDGERVEGTAAFSRMVRETPPGRTIELKYWRDGQSQSASVEVGSWKDEMHEAVQNMERTMSRQFVYSFPPGADLPMIIGRTPTLGIEAMDLSGQLAEYFGAPDGQGVLVSEVFENTPAAKAGLKAGDVITKLDGDRIHNVGELRARLQEKHAQTSVTLTLLRKGNELSLPVAPQQPTLPKPAVAVNRHMSI